MSTRPRTDGLEADIRDADGNALPPGPSAEEVIARLEGEEAEEA